MRIVVVGAGLIGLAVARRLGQQRPGAEITVLEKADRPAAHQSGHNSGVVHAGLYYPPGSLKAVLCRRGADLLREFCAEHGIVYDECGKLVVAVDESQRAALERLHERAGANGVPGLRAVDRAGIAELEPHVAGVAGLHSPHTAITDYVAIAAALAVEVRAAGGRVLLSTPVTGIDRTPTGARVRIPGGALAADLLVLCAGLQSDLVAGWAGDGRGPRVVPFRGEYYRLVPERAHLVRGLVYPVPVPDYPFLGVHLTRRVDGSVDLGPNAVLALAREGYRRRDVSAADLRDLVGWPGFRALARRHWRMGVHEVAGSVSRRVFLARARAYLPELRSADVVGAPAGVRAQAVDADGALVDDFRIHRLGPVTAVRNAPSPGATSCLAIAEHIADEVLASATG